MSKTNTKTSAKTNAAAKKAAPAKAASPKPAAKAAPQKAAVKKPEPKKTDTKADKATAAKTAAKKEADKPAAAVSTRPAPNEKPKPKPMTTGGRPGRKPKKKDDEEEGFVLEAPPEPHPVSRRKQKTPRDHAKERVLAKLREKALQEHASRQYLPSKKKKYTLEYIIKSSPVILFDFVSTSAGLEQWFADKVDDHLDIFTFTWEGNDQKAEMVEMDDLEYVKYRWVDNPYDEFFEFRITSTEITGDTVLLITDFAEANELRDVQFLWDSQVKTLMKRLGLGA